MNSLLEKLLYVVLAIVIISCATTAPMLPSADAVQWASFESDKLHIGLDLPSDFMGEEYDGDLFFRYKEKLALRLTLASDEDARRRGLWSISQPVAEEMIGNLPARKYIYDHYDGPLFDHFVTYVFQHRGQSLAIGFRTDQNELNSTQQRILQSIRLR